MDLINRLREISAKIPRVESHLETEEATKKALVMPFINSRGYNVFDPSEVVPEFTADVGTKKREKVDYAIMRDLIPIMLFECKSAGADLDKAHASQLYRYFSVTDARFGVLTNGIDYRFYSDLEQPNKMDSRAFFEFSMRSISDAIASELKKYAKETFDLDSILSTASELKYTKGIKRILTEEWINPSEDLVRLLTARVYSGRVTQSVKEQFTKITKKAFHSFVSDHVNQRLQSALEGTGSNDATAETAELTDEESDEQQPNSNVDTTEDELEAYYIVKSIVREVVDPRRIYIRDTQSYCGILLDDNNRKPICRLYFNSSQKYLGTFDGQKQVTRHAVDTVDEIYGFSEQLKETVAGYEDS